MCYYVEKFGSTSGLFQQMHVRSVILDNKIVGPLFLPYNLIGEFYCDLLESYIYLPSPIPQTTQPAPVDRSKNHWKSPEYAGSSVFLNTIKLPHRCSSNMAVFKAAFFRSLWSFHPWIFFSIGMFKIRNIFQPTGFNRRTSAAYSRRMLSDYTGCSTNVRRNTREILYYRI